MSTTTHPHSALILGRRLCFPSAGLLVLALGCRNATQPERSTTPPTGVQSHASVSRAPFGWPAPGAVYVVEQTLKKGLSITQNYFVRLCPDAKGDYALRFTDLEFSKPDGMSAADFERLRPQLTLVTRALPALIISPEGRYIGTGSWDEVLTELEKLLAANDLAGPELTSTLSAFRTPQMQALINASAGTYWMRWYAWWSGYDLSSVGSWSFDGRDAGLGPAPVNVEKVSAIGDSVHLRLSTTIPYLGPELRAVAEQLRSNGVQLEIPETVSATRAIVAEIKLNRATREPSWMKSSEVTRVTIDDDQTSEQVEAHEYWFDWTRGRALPNPCSQKK
jgi:hypothetical protein